MDDLTILNEIHKGVSMGMSSLEEISKKSDDKEFQDNLSFQYNSYREILDRVNKKFEESGNIPDDTPLNQKIMGWTGIQMNTLTDNSNSNLSEVLIQGYDMGIIKGTRLINQNPQADSDVIDILNEFVSLQENCINKLKRFL